MNIVLAQLKKDIQCQRGPLILWIICLGLGLVPFVILAVFSHMEHSHVQFANLTDMQKIAGALSYVAIFMLCMMAAAFGMFLLVPVLVIRIVHEDTLMGTTAFWLTRPVPREKLLLAKVLLIAVLLLPLLLGWGRDAEAGTDHFWPSEIAWIAAVAALAAITPGVQGLLGYGLSFFFGKIIFSGIIERVWAHYHGTDSIFPDGLLQFFTSTRHMFHLTTTDFIHLCYLAGFAAVFIHQYLTLRTRKSLVIFVTTLVTVALLQMITAAPPDPSSAPVIQFNSSHSSNWQTP